jgi:hypothetical protein
MCSCFVQEKSMAIGLTVLAENGARLADGPPLRVDHRPPYNGKQFDLSGDVSGEDKAFEIGPRGRTTRHSLLADDAN